MLRRSNAAHPSTQDGVDLAPVGAKRYVAKYVGLTGGRVSPRTACNQCVCYPARRVRSPSAGENPGSARDSVVEGGVFKFTYYVNQIKLYGKHNNDALVDFIFSSWLTR